MDFANKISGALGDADRPLFENREPLSTVAQRLGLTYGNARLRVHRRRLRIRGDLGNHLMELEPEHRPAVENLLKRAGCTGALAPQLWRGAEALMTSSCPPAIPASENQERSLT